MRADFLAVVQSYLSNFWSWRMQITPSQTTMSTAGTSFACSHSFKTHLLESRCPNPMRKGPTKDFSNFLREECNKVWVQTTKYEIHDIQNGIWKILRNSRTEMLGSQRLGIKWKGIVFCMQLDLWHQGWILNIQLVWVWIGGNTTHWEWVKRCN